MLDYYSEFPGPDEDHAKKTIQGKFYKVNVDKEYKLFLSNIKVSGTTQTKLINEAFESSDVIKEGRIKFSFSGWMLFGIPDIMHFLKIAIENYYNKTKRRVRGVFKSLIYLNMIYSDTLEKMYKPESNYVKNVIKPRYNKTNQNRNNKYSNIK